MSQQPATRYLDSGRHGNHHTPTVTREGSRILLWITSGRDTCSLDLRVPFGVREGFLTSPQVNRASSEDEEMGKIFAIPSHTTTFHVKSDDRSFPVSKAMLGLLKRRILSVPIFGEFCFLHHRAA